MVGTSKKSDPESWPLIWQLRIPDTAIWYSYGIHGTCIDHLWFVVLVKHADVPWNHPKTRVMLGATGRINILFRAGMETKKQNTTIFVGFTSLARFFPHGIILLYIYICFFMYNCTILEPEPEINGGFPKQPFVVQALCHSETANIFLVVGANRPRSTASEATLRQSMGPMGYTHHLWPF